MLLNCLKLFWTFLKIGAVGFGGGYAMLSMITTEAQKFSVTLAQIADLNALDMLVPGPIAINAATYVGYLYAGVWGSLAATIGVSLPSFALAIVVLRFLSKFQNSLWLADLLSGVKPAAVGLIAAAALTIASDVLTKAGKDAAGLLTDPLGTISIACVIIFAVVAALNIRWKVNPILLTLLAGVAGAFLLA